MILMFSAEWCSPCKTIKQWLPDDVVVLDADVEHDLVNQYKVRSVPTFVKIKNGDMRTGSMSEREFHKWVNEQD